MYNNMYKFILTCTPTCTFVSVGHSTLISCWLSKNLTSGCTVPSKTSYPAVFFTIQENSPRIRFSSSSLFLFLPLQHSSSSPLLFLPSSSSSFFFLSLMLQSSSLPLLLPLPSSSSSSSSSPFFVLVPPSSSSSLFLLPQHRATKRTGNYNGGDRGDSVRMTRNATEWVSLGDGVRCLQRGESVGLRTSCLERSSLFFFSPPSSSPSSVFSSFFFFFTLLH